MDHATQVELARRLLELKRSGESQLSETTWRNPVDGYTSRELHERERQVFFRDAPIFAGLSCDVKRPGDFFVIDVAGLAVLVVRGRDGVLRAFENVCRHRGAPVVSGRGNVKARFVCPYHAWAYEVDGRLARASHASGFADRDPAELGLMSLPVSERHGLVYVRPAPGAPIDLDPVLAGVERELAPFRFENWALTSSVTNRRSMNWKLVVDTFMEAYHLATLHKTTLAPMFERDLALFEAFGDNGRLVAARRSFAELEEQPEATWNLLPHCTVLWFLFPNVVLIHQQDHAQLWQIYPDGDSPDHSVAEVHVYAPEPDPSEATRRHLQKNMDLLMQVTNDEDFELGERIQRSFRHARQSSILYGRNEPALTHYHRAIRRHLGLEEVSSSPPN